MTPRSAWVTCSGCRGYGVVTNGMIIADTCDVCRGLGIERRRDPKGRFSK